MVVDKPEHRDFLLEALDAVTIPTKVADLFMEVRAALRDAAVAPEPNGSD